MKLISVMNKKGGVGKTTIAFNISAELSKRDLKVLAVDLDGQGSLTQTCRNQVNANITDLLKYDLSELVVNQEYLKGNFDLLSSNNELTENKQIKKAIDELIKKAVGYDVVVVDCAPSYDSNINELMKNSDYVIIPTNTDLYSFKGVGSLFEKLKEVYQEHKINVGVLVTRYKARSNYGRMAFEHLKVLCDTNGIGIFDTTIREMSALNESIGYGLNVCDYAPKSAVAEDMKKFIDELMEWCEL